LLLSLFLPLAFKLVSFLAYSPNLKMETMYSAETFVDFQRINGVISQKIELIITTALRTSNSIEKLVLSCTTSQ
jgi:hypothetical protein